MKESEGKKEEARTAERFPPNFINEQKKRAPVTVFAWAYILPQNNTNDQNQQKQLTVTRTNWEEIKRGIKRQKFKWAARTVSLEVNSGRKWQIHNTAKFRSNPAKFLQCSIFFTFCSSFLLGSDMQ